MRRTVGRFAAQKTVDLPSRFDDFMLGQDAFSERLGLIPAEVAPSRIEDIIAGASRGKLGPLYELYRKMEVTDSRFGGLVDQFLSAIGGVDLKLDLPDGLAGEERAVAEDIRALVEENLALIDTHALTSEFARAHLSGVRVLEHRFAIHEFPYGRRLALIDECRPVSLAALEMDTDTKSKTRGELLLKQQGQVKRRPLSSFPDAKLNVLEAGYGRGFYDTMGAARRCLSWWITKIYAQMWWTEFVEVYGQPIRMARYPTNASPKVRNTIEEFLRVLGKSAYGLFPQGVEVQLLESNKSGSVTTYKDIIQMANQEMAVTLLGQAETTGENKYGSRAKAEVMNGVRYEILRAVAALVRKGYGQFVRSLVHVNYGDVSPRLLPKVRPVLLPGMAMGDVVEAINKLQREGTPVPVEHVYEQTGVPAPRPGERVLVQGQILVVNEEGELQAVSAEARANAAPEPASTQANDDE